MNLLDLFNVINTLTEKIEANRCKLITYDKDSKEFNKLFIETSRLIDELTFYSNQLEYISSYTTIEPYN